jgi:hypothetical protein
MQPATAASDPGNSQQRHFRERASLRRALHLLREPVPAEKRDLLRARWQALDPAVRYPLQGFGQQATGCGATVGIYPKCDFDRQGCYLGAEANSVPRFPLAEAFRQLETLRGWLGPKANVQITDGEVTLLPEAELIAILRRARELGTIPMVMSHGDTFRRKPELLHRLVLEGGLREVSLHVDSLQRGRRGWRDGASEEELMAVREELAGMLREVRRQTGIRVRAATTMTIDSSNLEAVPAVVDWTLRNRDAFSLISFQPLAQVGRTRQHLRGVSVEALWQRIATALRTYGFADAERSPLQLGHADCTRIEPLAVVERPGQVPRVVQIVRPGHEEDAAIVRGFFERGLGGLNFRDDPMLERVCRTIGALARDPRWFAGQVRRWVADRCAELGTGLAGMGVGTLTGRLRVDSFVVTSHHFMSPEEAISPRGQERLAACVFRLPVGDEMVPMCRLNSSGLRSAVYAQGTAASAGPRLPVLA